MAGQQNRNLQSPPYRLHLPALAMIPVLFFAFLFASRAFADAYLSSTAADAKYNLQSTWSLPISFESSSNLYAPSTYEHEAQETIALMPSYRLTEAWKLNAMILIFKDESGDSPDNTGFDNTSVSLTNVHTLNSSLLWLNSVSGILPTNQQLRDDTSYEGAVKASTGLLLTNLFAGSSLRYMASLERNFHQYSEGNDGEYNLRDDFGQTVEFMLPITRKFMVDTSFGYTLAETYLSDLRTRFTAEIDVIWMVNKAWSVSVGTSNEGSALKPNGVDSNVAFFDDTSSVVKFNLTYLL